MSIEGELGHVGDNPDPAEEASQSDDPGKYFTDPKMAKDYVEKTGVDALAIAVGNAHGAYKLSPRFFYGHGARISQTSDLIS